MPDVKLSGIGVIRLAYIILIIAGGGSVARLYPEFGEYKVFLDLRFVGFLIITFILIISLMVGSVGLKNAPLNSSGRIWFGLYFLLNIFVVVSTFWVDVSPHEYAQLAEVFALIWASVIFLALFYSRLDLAVTMLLAVGYYISLLAIIIYVVFLDGIEHMLGEDGVGGIGIARIGGIGTIAGVAYFLLKHKAIYLIPLPLFFGAVLFSGSRGTLLGLAFALFILFLKRRVLIGGGFSSLLNSSTKTLHIIFSVAVVSVLGFVYFNTFFEYFLPSIFVGGDSPVIYLADRDEIFSDAWRQLLENPVFGVGLGGYETIEGEFGWYPHNILLNYAVSAGGLALSLFVFTAGWALYLMWNCASPLCVLATSVAVFNLIFAQFAGSYYDARLFWFMAMVVVISRYRKVRQS